MTTNPSMTPLFGKPLEPGSPKYTADFEYFWLGSSRRGSKLLAFKAWSKMADQSNSQLYIIMAAMAQWQQSEQWQAGIIPHVSTWLNRRGWEEIVPRPAHQHTAMCREFGFCPEAREDQV